MTLAGQKYHCSLFGSSPQSATIDLSMQIVAYDFFVCACTLASQCPCVCPKQVKSLHFTMISTIDTSDCRNIYPSAPTSRIAASSRTMRYTMLFIVEWVMKKQSLHPHVPIRAQTLDMYPKRVIEYQRINGVHKS